MPQRDRGCKREIEGGKRKGKGSEQTGDYDYTNLPVAAIVMFINSDFEPLPSLQSTRKQSPEELGKNYLRCRRQIEIEIKI